MLLLLRTTSRAFSQFRASRKYHHSFGRNSVNTWQELPERMKSDLRYQLERRDGKICKHCNRTDLELTVDHIVPIRAGGPVCDTGNLQLLCRDCHEIKTLTIDIKYVSRSKVLIYNYHKVRQT